MSRLYAFRIRWTFLLVMVFIVAGPFAASAQFYNTLTPSRCIATDGDTVNLIFNGVPSPATGGTVTFYYEGDLDGTGANLENFEIFSENGGFLVATNSVSQCSGFDSVTYTAPIDSLIAWSADGVISFVADASQRVGPTVCAQGTCISARLEYTFVTVPNDARVSSLVSPKNFCAGTQAIVAEVGNSGTNQINSLVVNWTFDGVLQSPATVNTLLDTVGGLGANSTQVVLGVQNFPNGVAHDIVVWTSQPNGVADGNTVNDTLAALGIRPSFDGTFTIGGTNPDFASFSTAVSELTTFGVCGPVVFKVRPGVYREQVSIGQINGTSAVNSITFESETGDSSSVVLSHSSVFGSNYTLQLNGADHVNFNQMTLISDAVTYETVVALDNGSSHIRFTNCAFIGDTSGTTSTNAALINSNNSSSEHFITFQHCLLRGGSYGIYTSGSSASPERDWVVENCLVFPHYRGLYFSSATGTRIHGNQVVSNTFSNYTSFTGIYLVNTDSVEAITANYINAEAGVYGMYFSGATNYAGNPALVANNMIHAGGSGSSRGIYLTGSTAYFNFYHNTIHVSSSSTLARGIDVASSAVSNLELYNNIIVVSGSGNTLYTTSTSAAAITSSDYNCLFSTQGTLATWAGTAVSDLASLRAASNFENNSLSLDPGFFSQTDLHVTSGLLDNKGIVLPGITTDIDGDIRSPLTPDIGADEFDPLQNDLTILGFTSPSQLGCDVSDSTDITVLIANNGLVPQNFFSVSLRIFAVDVTTEQVNQTILPGDTLVYTFNTKVNLSVPSIYPLRVWVDLPGDQLPTNDTIGPYFLIVDGLVDQFPYVVNFDDAFGAIPDKWRNDDFDDGEQWFAGQSADNISGDNTTGSGFFAFVDNSSPHSNNTSLLSPCLDISGLARPTLEFYLNNSSSSMLLHIDVLYQGVWIEDVVPVMGNQNGIWAFQRVDLAPYTGETIKIRFRAQEIGTSSLIDLGIDDIKIYNLPPINTAVLAALQPSSGCSLTDIETVEALVRHIGFDTLNVGDQVPISFQVDNGPIFTEQVVITQTVAPGDSFTYEFFNVANLITPKSYSLKIWTAHPLDDDFSNDTLQVDITNIPNVTSFPYQEDFENGRGGWTAGGINSSWAYGDPNNATINTALDGEKVWATGQLVGDYNNNEQSYVQGPCFDFSTIFRPQVNLDIWWECFTNSDGAAFLYSIDDGQTWQTAGSQGEGVNWYTSNAISGNPGGQGAGWSGSGINGSQFWRNAKLDLPQLAGQPSVLFRMVFGSNAFSTTDGVAFDNVLIGNAPVINLPDTIRGCGFVKLDAGATGLLYQWSNGANQQTTIIQAGPSTTTQTITLYVEDNLGLYAEDQVVVVLEPGPYVDLGSDGVICGEDTVQLDAGNPGANYQWNDGSSNRTLRINADGTYSVTVSSFGCSHADTIEVDLEPFPDADFAFGTNPQGNTIFDFTNQASGATSYQWWFGDGYFSTQNSPTHFYAQPGTYEVLLIAMNDCGTDTARQTLTIYPTGMGSLSNSMSVQVAPNPASTATQLWVDHNHAGETIGLRLIDLQGRVVWQKVVELSGEQLQLSIPLHRYATGLYQLQLLHQEGTLQRSIVKQ